MATAPAETDPRKTARWQVAREVARQRAGYPCSACRAPDSPDNPLEVDHVHPIALGGDPYDANNLRVLCKRCYIRAHGGIPQREHYRRERRERRAKDSVEPPWTARGCHWSSRRRRCGSTYSSACWSRRPRRYTRAEPPPPITPEGHRQRARQGYPDLTGHRPRALIDYLAWAVPIVLVLWLSVGIVAAGLGG